jgi:sphingolipid delta-4 desaturase
VQQQRAVMVAVADRPGASRFLWVSSGEPHAIRRRELLSKYGEQIRKLYGYDHATAYQVIAVVITQFILAYAVRDWDWWKVWVAAYVVSGTLNQNLFCAQHEIRCAQHAQRAQHASSDSLYIVQRMV